MDPIEPIRNLRAKAESTTFPAEAEAFRAKADQPMERHGITETDLYPPVSEPQIQPIFGQPVVTIIFGTSNLPFNFWIRPTSTTNAGNW
jgi:hypothetical protein